MLLILIHKLLQVLSAFLLCKMSRDGCKALVVNISFSGQGCWLGVTVESTDELHANGGRFVYWLLENRRKNERFEGVRILANLRIHILASTSP